MIVNWDKNRSREKYTFANINLLGRCNFDCFFCLGKDMKSELEGKNQLNDNFQNWENFQEFLELCCKYNINKIYITGQNTDSLMYYYLRELIDYLRNRKFDVGLRTNGCLALDKIDIINQCNLSVGYSIHSLNPITNRSIIGRSNSPDWDTIIPKTNNPRIQIVINRYNEQEFFEILRYLERFSNIKYIQARRISTDTRQDILSYDVASYERVYTEVNKIFPIERKLWFDAEEYMIYSIPVVFWRTVKTSVNSINYFTDGVISNSYFIVEGYLKNCKKN